MKGKCIIVGRHVVGVVVVFAGVLALSGRATCDTPVYRDEPSGDYLRSWLLCGPFPVQEISDDESELVHLPGFETDFLAAHGGEATPSIAEGQVEPFAGGSASWFSYTSDQDAISLDDAVSQVDYQVAYGYCEIESESEQVCILALGTNDGGRLWLNGELIWERMRGRGLALDDDLIAVKLRKGRNRLLAKIEERGGSWGLAVRFLPLNGELLAADAPLFDVTTDRDGVATLEFRHPVSVAEDLFESVAVEVRHQGAPATPVWQGDWTRERTMPLRMLDASYGKYIAHVAAKVRDGYEWTAGISFEAGTRLEHVLFEAGATDYSIVLGSDALESEQWAAQELQHWIEEVGGVTLPIRLDTEPLDVHEIVVGYNAHARALLGTAVEAPEDADESFRFQNVGPAIAIWGGRQRGTMYGVSTFLERELGCRWYSCRVSEAPKRSRYAFTYLRHSESPGLRVRNVYYHDAFDPTWAPRQKINGSLGNRQQPGGVELYWGVHTFYGFVPPGKYFDEHPEYFSLINGERTHTYAQLCLTNPDVLAITVEGLREVMRNSPEYLIYSVSHLDWAGHCECDACQALVDREGSQAGPLLWFVNQVAEQVEEEFPDKFIGTLAYGETQKPPKTICPRQNVVIRLCSTGCRCHSFEGCSNPYTDGENMLEESFLSRLENWSAIAPHLYIWDYIVNFANYMTPFPNFHVLQPNIRAFRDNHAIGVMEQAAGQGPGTEFQELRAYVLAKLLWNPECDVDEIIDDFMAGFYGRSGQYVRAYFDLLHGQITDDTHMPVDVKVSDVLFADPFLAKAEALFDKAEAVADNDAILHRVQRARLSIMNLKCWREPFKAKQDGTYDRFNAIVEREGVTHYAEYGGGRRVVFEKWMASTE